MTIHRRYRGIFYMLLAALGFSLMGGSAKLLKGGFNAGQLVFFRNLVGAVGLTIAFLVKPPVTGAENFTGLFSGGSWVRLHYILYCIAFCISLLVLQ